ncbi:cellulose-binding protein [Mycolicibacterium litorale]|nr:cellulose-binding protein [Mycolicibacterium litorale]
MSTAVATLVPCLSLVLPMAVANAHGYVSSPPSRQAQCAQNAAVLKCGAIQYEPQSVEGPQGLRSCSGGNAKFAALDDDSRPWKVSPVTQNASFTWTFTANHKTANWEYYIGNTRVGYVDGGNQPAPAGGVTHTVNLSKFSGRQKLIAIWNIGDTPNAFYSCVDLQIGGTPTTSTTATTTTTPPTTTTTTPPPPTTTTPPPTTSATTPPTGPKQWAAGAKYSVGDVVTYGGTTYRCLQAHTVYDATWTPPNTPALWQKVS